MGAIGADEVVGADSLGDCLAACISDSKCVAVEYSQTFKCWMHKNADYTNKLEEVDDVTLYVLHNCKGQYISAVILINELFCSPIFFLILCLIFWSSDSITAGGSSSKPTSPPSYGQHRLIKNIMV